MEGEEKNKSIFWFRQDLRIADNPALHQAVLAGEVFPIFIIDVVRIEKIGQASRWWLYHSLQKLDASLNHSLNFYEGKPEEILLKIAQKHKMTRIFCNRIDEPECIDEDKSIERNLAKHGLEFKVFSSNLLWEPWQIVKTDQTAYKVYTPFYRNGCLSAQPPRYPLSVPKNLKTVKDVQNSIKIEALIKLLGQDWHVDRKNSWQIGEQAAHDKLQNFLKVNFAGYKINRDFPDRVGVSRLSPHIHFGEISPHQIWYGIEEFSTKYKVDLADIDCFYKQLGWREFSYNLLYHFPDLPDKNFQKKFDNFSWHYNIKLLHAWQQGQTGYPIVDAGMRQLMQTGYMHNRVRMVVASFLVKNLLIDWRHGRDWFWDRLVDADLANNSVSWQWVAGCGVDAAPYFRIFNPTLQGEKFDKHGVYTREFVPELQHIPDKYLFEPWKAPESILKQAGIILGKNYPKPIVSLEDSRKLALNIYKLL